jgi:hypothetical protein
VLAGRPSLGTVGMVCGEPGGFLKYDRVRSGLCVGLGGKAGMPSGKSLGGLARYGGVRLPFGDVLRECFRFCAVTISKSFGPCFYVDVWFSCVFCNGFFY